MIDQGRVEELGCRRCRWNPNSWAGAVPDARSSRRGRGPFTGGQLTAIILGALLAISFPVGALGSRQLQRRDH